MATKSYNPHFGPTRHSSRMKDSRRDKRVHTRNDTDTGYAERRDIPHTSYQQTERRKTITLEHGPC